MLGALWRSGPLWRRRSQDTRGGGASMTPSWERSRADCCRLSVMGTPQGKAGGPPSPQRDPWRALVMLSILAATAWGQAGLADPARVKSEPAGIQVRPAAPISPLNGFVENRGQWHPDVRFLARKGGIEAVLLRDALVLHPLSRAAPPLTEEQERLGLEPHQIAVPGPPLTIRFPAPQSIEGEGQRPTQHHFHFGSGSTSHVPGFDQVVYFDVAPGIDLVVRTGAEWFAYDVHAAPGADLGALTLEIEGATAAEIENGTVLALETSAGRVEQRLEASWQVDPVTGAQVSVPSRFRLAGAEIGGEAGQTSLLRFGFEAPGRDPTAALVIDPSLAYATYVGGSGNESFEDMDVSPNGEVLLVARSYSGPTTPGAYQPTGAGSLDGWAGKLSPDGSTLLWSTYLGGSDAEELFSGHLDQADSVVLTGRTFSTNFPTTPGVWKPVMTGDSDVFIARLSADGSDLLWATYHGGDASESARDSGLYPNGDVFVTAEPFDTFLTGGLPVATPGAFDPVHEVGKHYLARISADGTQQLFLTYFRCSTVSGVAIDATESVYFAGRVFSEDQPLPVTPGVLKERTDGTSDAYVAKLDGSGTQLHWATYIGGDDNSDVIQDLAIDVAGAVYISGWTGSTDFPLTAGAFDTTSVSGGSGYVAKLLPRATGFVWSTYLTACCTSSPSSKTGVVVDGAGSAFVSGHSNQATYPVTDDAYQSSYAGGFPASDMTLTRLDVFGETLEYSTYFGGGGSELLAQVGLDAQGHVYAALNSSSSTMPTTPGAYDSTYNGGSSDLAAVSFSGFMVAPWRVLGGGLVGSTEVPYLAGKGDLTPGSPARLSVRGAKPLATAMLVAGLPAIEIPFKGGTMVPNPTVLLPLATTATGGLDLPFAWPSAPPGISLYVQFWIQDPGAFAGWSASNALELISQ
ncbi:MAG: DUF7948 domain-containing protein [Planctomycetota bacterium]